MNTTQSGYDINELYREAQSRWLKPAEVFFILQNHEKYNITQEPAKKPSSGCLFLFNKRVLRFFRRDGHNWRKKKDGRAVGEAHERLKVGNVETLNCYYAHGEDNPSFQRRSYWMLDPAYEHIVLVHYRDITDGNPRSASQSAGSLLSFGQSPSPSSPQNAGSISVSDYQSLTSPGSIEVSSDAATIVFTSEHNNYNITGTEELSHGSAEFEVTHALKKLEEQLSLNEDSFRDYQVEDPNDLVDYQTEFFNPATENVVHDQYLAGYAGLQAGKPVPELKNAQETVIGDHQFTGQEHAYGRKKSLSWKDVLDSCHTSSAVESQPNDLSFSGRAEEQQHHQWQNYSGSSVGNEVRGTNSDDYTVLFDQGQIGGAFESDVSLTVAQKQKFNIQEISPEWGFASESTKVLIIGSFLCDASESTWHCMFGNVEVPVQVIQEGVISCKAPPLPTGKVTLCITSGNRESCSEVREFEYRQKGSEGNLPPTESTRSPDELLFLVKFIQMLLSDSSTPKKDIDGIDSYVSVIEALSFGTGTSSSTIDWLLEELLKDKLHHWMSSRSKERHDPEVCALSKRDQGIIHLVSGLGFEWALASILSCGVSINFRDIKGWTALHWAARFGREKMVGALIASGASAGAVTDPSSENPTGETAASIAARSGHKGLAGYLSEVALTSHLTSLTLGESELSKGSAELEAEQTLSAVPKPSLTPFEDQLSLKHSLAAVRNAAQAAARIQSAFRAHSFRRRQERGASSWGVDEYGMNADEISAMSRLGYRSPRDHNFAAVSIQKKFRGYKGRKDYLAFRQNVVKLQAYVRGYQVRKHYKVICWAVGVLEKVVLRWRRKGAGLRGFRPETDSIDEPVDDDDEEDDILKVFRKQKVDGAINQAISRVLSMVKSSEARQQYHRVLQKYCQKKAELGGSSSEAATPTGVSDFYGIEDIDMYSFP